jgi:hypothetical protein
MRLYGVTTTENTVAFLVNSMAFSSPDASTDSPDHKSSQLSPKFKHCPCCSNAKQYPTSQQPRSSQEYIQGQPSLFLCFAALIALPIDIVIAYI